jgi:hypothetical protein
LDTVPDDANNSSNEDEEERAVHAHDGTRENRAVFCERLLGHVLIGRSYNPM